MKALILAGGLGTRLRPLTYNHPKPLLPIANRSHIEHIFDLLSEQSITEVVLLTSYMAAAFDETRKRASRRGIDVQLAVEEEPLGTAGAIKNGESLVGGDSFFVFNGDVLTDVDLGEFHRLHSEAAAEASIMLTPVEDPSAFGVVPTEETGRVKGFIEKPEPGTAPTNHINAGVYLFEPSVLQRIPPDEVFSTEKTLFPGMVEDDRDLFAFTLGSYWIDIGTPATYLRANLDALSGTYETSAAAGVDARETLVAQGANVSDEASLRSVCVGEGAVVEPGARIERCVLLPGAAVLQGAEVHDSIIGGDAVIGSAARVDGQVISSDEQKEIV